MELGLDAGTAAIIVAASGIVLWLVTQIHLLKVARRIEANIDSKREETQAFVDSRISKLEATVGGFEARMTAQMPPNLHGEIEDVRAEILSLNQGVQLQIQVNGDVIRKELEEQVETVRSEIEEFNIGLRKEFEGLPGRLKSELALAEGSRSQEMMAAAAQLKDGLNAEIGAINAQIPPEMQGLDIRAKVMKAIAREPTPKERKEMGVVGELVWTAGRAKLAEWLQAEGVPGIPSVTLTRTAARGGNMEM